MSQRLQLLQSMLAENPADPFLLFATAKEFEGLGETAEALHFYEKLRQSDPNYVGLYYHFGKLLEKTGDSDAALKIYDTGIEVAKSAGDRHAAAELAGARLEIADE